MSKVTLDERDRLLATFEQVVKGEVTRQLQDNLHPAIDRELAQIIKPLVEASRAEIESMAHQLVGRTLAALLNRLKTKLENKKDQG